MDSFKDISEDFLQLVKDRYEFRNKANSNAKEEVSKKQYNTQITKDNINEIIKSSLENLCNDNVSNVIDAFHNIQDVSIYDTNLPTEFFVASYNIVKETNERQIFDVALQTLWCIFKKSEKDISYIYSEVLNDFIYTLVERGLNKYCAKLLIKIFDKEDGLEFVTDDFIQRLATAIDDTDDLDILSAQIDLFTYLMTVNEYARSISDELLRNNSQKLVVENTRLFKVFLNFIVFVVELFTTPQQYIDFALSNLFIQIITSFSSDDSESGSLILLLVYDLLGVKRGIITTEARNVVLENGITEFLINFIHEDNWSFRLSISICSELCRISKPFRKNFMETEFPQRLLEFEEMSNLSKNAALEMLATMCCLTDRDPVFLDYCIQNSIVLIMGEYMEPETPETMMFLNAIAVIVSAAIRSKDDVCDELLEQLDNCDLHDQLQDVADSDDEESSQKADEIIRIISLLF